MSSAVIFGGTGFIGTTFANYLSQLEIYESIYLLDIEGLSEKKNEYRNNLILCNKSIKYHFCDVRLPIIFDSTHKVDLIANFAAIHREPGHENSEYFATNLLGAENVCKFAERVGCQNMIFTSSISPYGVSESAKDEKTLPIPVTAYGSSKLVAEKIHQIWQAKEVKSRRLIIVRSGVVFGPGEGGNVSRLIKAVTRRYFYFMGNKNTRKAGIYVKELCNAMWWVLQEQNRKGEVVSLFNMSMNPGPSIGEYVEAVCKTQKIKRFIPTVSYRLLVLVAYIIDFVAKPFGIKHPFSPIRIRKLVRSNNIIPTYLLEHGYQFQYSLDCAFADWKKSCPEEWL